MKEKHFMDKQTMRQLANVFCRNACSTDKMLDCDCRGKSCTQLAGFLLDIKKLETKQSNNPNKQ